MSEVAMLAHAGGYTHPPEAKKNSGKELKGQRLPLQGLSLANLAMELLGYQSVRISLG